MMRQCDLGFEHDDPEPEQVIVDQPAVADAAEAEANAGVEIARVNRDADVQIAKIAGRQLDEATAAEMAALRARLDILEAARLPDPEPEPEPVVVETAPAEPEPEPVAAPPETPEPPKEEKKSSGFWGPAYR
jgi:hypothetical protein